MIRSLAPLAAVLGSAVVLGACEIPQADECRELLERDDCTGLDEETAGEAGICWRTTIELAEQCRAHCRQSLQACDADAGP